MDVCLENEILKELLSVHRAEVKHVILTEYNEELHLKNTFEEGREEGLKEGRKEGLAEGQAPSPVYMSGNAWITASPKALF